MSKLWDFIFNRDKTVKTKINQTLIHETFDINLKDPKYLSWKEETTCSHAARLITEAIISYKSSTSSKSPYIEIIEKKTYSGIAIKRNIPSYTTQDYRYLLFYLIEYLLQEQYIKKLSEVRSYLKGKHLNLHYNVYLKPSFKIQQGFPLNQLFGNIQIELLLRDDIFNTFRIKSMVYHDRNYQEATSFLEYMLTALRQ